jgi:hypothetical protein
MASVSIGRTDDVERAIAKRLGLDPSDILAGSIRVESSDGKTERVTWECVRIVPAGFMYEIVAEVSR